MSKRKRNFNIRHKGGGRYDNVISDPKRNARLRHVGQAAAQQRLPDLFWLWLLALTVACLAAAYVFR